MGVGKTKIFGKAPKRSTPIHCGADPLAESYVYCYISTGFQSIEELSICFSYVESGFIKCKSSIWAETRGYFHSQFSP